MNTEVKLKDKDRIIQKKALYYMWEAAVLLSHSKDTLRKMRRMGVVKTVDYGYGPRVPQSEIDRLSCVDPGKDLDRRRGPR